MRFNHPFIDGLMTVANLALIAITPLLLERLTTLPLWACVLLGIPAGVILFWLVLFGLRFANVTFLTLTPLLLIAITPLPIWACFLIGIPGGLIVSWILQSCASRLLANRIPPENSGHSVI